MIPFDKLTRFGKIRRFRRLAKAALDAYGMADAHFTFVRLAGNAIFRVFAPDPGPVKSEHEPFEEGQYLLRIHDRSEQATGAVKSEMEWLSAIRRDAGLAVPEPVAAPDGKLLIRVSHPGIPGKRDCTLLRWVKGRFVRKGARPRHFRAQGRLMAQLHSHAERWQPPTGFIKRRFDPDGLFRDDAGAGLPNGEAWALLQERCRKPFETVARKTTQVMEELGKGAGAYGLIHGDCGIDANVLFWNGEARAIDFDGSGFGYYAYDLSLALEHCWKDAAYPEYREALLNGYAEFRSLPDDQVEHLDLFLAAFYVYMSLWTAALDKIHPNSPNGPYRRRRWLERGLEYIEPRMAGFQ